MNLTIASTILSKLTTKHGVPRREVEQYFENLSGGFLLDIREKYKTTPPTQWFLARTNQNRILKVVFILDDGVVYLKTAYPPNKNERDIYEKHFGSV